MIYKLNFVQTIILVVFMLHFKMEGISLMLMILESTLLSLMLHW